MIEKVASHWKCGENNDFYDDLKYDSFCDFGSFSAGRQYKTNKQKQWIHQWTVWKPNENNENLTVN